MTSENHFTISRKFTSFKGYTQVIILVLKNYIETAVIAVLLIETAGVDDINTCQMLN